MAGVNSLTESTVTLSHLSPVADQSLIYMCHGIGTRILSDKELHFPNELGFIYLQRVFKGCFYMRKRLQWHHTPGLCSGTVHSSTSYSTACSYWPWHFISWGTQSCSTSHLCNFGMPEALMHWLLFIITSCDSGLFPRAISLIWLYDARFCHDLFLNLRYLKVKNGSQEA